MPILTGICFTLSPSKTKTTSTGLGASFDFLSALGLFVPVAVAAFVAAGAFVAGGESAALAVLAMEAVPLVFDGLFVLPMSLGIRVVTAASGTVRTLVR